MNIDDFNSLKHKLEPEASAGGDENNESLVLSMAVSLKRIADHQERIANSLENIEAIQLAACPTTVHLPHRRV